MEKIGFIGTGKMASAIIKGLVQTKTIESQNIIGFDVYKPALEKLSQETGIGMANDIKELVNLSDVVFLAVRPQDAQTVLTDIKEIVGEKFVMSIITGYGIDKMRKYLGENAKICRIVPNSACLVGESVNTYALSENATDRNDFVEKILISSGITLHLKEEQLDIITGLSGSGIAFFYILAEAFANSAQNLGLSKEDALRVTAQTMKGSGVKILESGLPIEDLIKQVATPGGTTIEGMKVLNESDVKEMLGKTLEAAVNRAKKLGSE